MKKTKQQILRVLFILSFISFLQTAKAQQIYVNKEWRDEHGSPVFNPLLAPYGGDWTKSIISSINAEVITVAHTNISGQGENILLTRYDDSGSQIWQTDFNSTSTHNDYGIDVIEDPNTGDIYVCGTTDNGGITNYDVLVLIYDANGNLQYDTRYDGPDGLNDIPGAIKIDSNGNLVIAGTSEYSSTLFDYLILNFDPSLNLNWYNTYDYANLTDIAVALEIDGGKVTVAGGSANSLTDVDMTLVQFDESNGNLIADNRMSYPGFGYDEITSFRKDAAGNFYITGKCSSNGIDYDIRVIKVDNTNTLLWSQSYNAFNLEDVGTTIGVDGSGNVVVGGYITRSGNKKDLIVLKYNSSGTLLWKHSQASNDVGGDAIVKALSLNTLSDDIYIIGGDKELNSNKRAIVARFFPNGRVAWEKYIKGNYDYLPSDVQYGGLGTPGIFAIAIKDSTINSYELNFFSEHEVDTATFYTPSGSPVCPKRQLITRFDTSAIIKPMIDNKNIVYGQIEDFVKAGVVSSLKSNLGSIYGTNDFEIKVYKIFPELTTTYTATISRLGDVIPIPEFYSILLLELPAGLNITSAANNLESLFPNIIFTHPNYLCTVTASNPNATSPNTNNDFGKILASANDSLYSQCASLHPTSSYSAAHVNAEEAWDLETGKRHVKVGVFDTGAFWGHRDFMDSTKTITKITGWDFLNGAPLINDPQGEGLNHGTQVSGIIAANRNSHVGIAGIAGGNFKTDNSYLDSSGINLHGMRVLLGGGQFAASNYLNYIADAIVNASIDDASANSYKYGLHIMNHSWRISNANSYVLQFLNDTNITILREATHFANRANVTFVAATGNEFNGNPSYPAGIDDDWVLTVGGSGTDGQWDASQASFKNYIDLVAPSYYSLIWTLGWAGFEFWDVGGTSLSAPHVSGAAALMMSYYNKPYSHPDNLAPEDIEFLLQKSATDINVPNYDDTTGWGRLNIGKAINMIKKPQRKVKHLGTDNSTHNFIKTHVTPNDTVVKLTERYKNAAGVWFLPNIKYHVKTYEIKSMVQLTVSPTETILYYWSRHSSTNTLESKANGKLRPRERTSTFINNYQFAVLTSYVYKVRDSLGNPLGWWPFDTSTTNLKLTFSMLVKDTAADVGINELKEPSNFIKVYPNPTSGNQILEIVSRKGSDCRINIYDMLGRNVYNQDNVKTDKGNNKIPIPTNGFPNGMYIYNVKLDDEYYYYKILKQ